MPITRPRALISALASSKVRPLPATRSRTVWETTTCEAPAVDMIRDPIVTAMPPVFMRTII